MSTPTSRKKSRRDYFLEDGTPVPATTDITALLAKPYLIGWANREGLKGIDTTEYVDQAAIVGNCAHLMIASYLRKVEPDLSAYSQETINQAENSLIKFYEWEKRIGGIEPILVEESLVSELHGYGGTIDCYCRIGDQHWLIDIKTGKKIYSEMGIQLAAYQNLLREQGLPVDGCRILRFGRDEDEGFEDKTVGEAALAKDFGVFDHLLAIYRINKTASAEKKQETEARRKATAAEKERIQQEKQLAKAAAQEEKERLKAEKLAVKTEKVLLIASSKVQMVRPESVVELV